MGRHRRKRITFGKLYIAYVFILLALIIALFFYVYNVAKQYENTQPENYVISLIEHVGKNDKAVGSFLQEHCFDPSNVGDGEKRSADFYNKAAFSQLKAVCDYQNSSDDLYVYNITADDKPFVTIAIKRIKTTTKLILFNINSYELEYVAYRNDELKKGITSYNEDGTITCEVIYPAEFTLLFDGKEINNADAQPAVLEEFESMKSYEELPKGSKAVINLYYEPKIEVLNNAGKKVPVEYVNGVYYAACDYAEDDKAREIIESNLDPVKIYELWAEFSYDEVNRSVVVDECEGSHGIATVLNKCRILPGSNHEADAKDFAYGIDITFVSDHWAHRFSNEKVKNFILYNDDFVSCDVSFDCTYNLNNGSTKVVNFSARMYFIKSAGQWYWVGQKDFSND